MRKTREILRLKWVHGRSHREIARAIGVGVGSPTQVVVRAKRAQITCWAEVEALSDEELKGLIQSLTAEETEISYRRRILHGKIDILRAELVNRLRKKHEGGEDVISGDDVQRLTDILAGKAGVAPDTGEAS